MNLIKAHKNVMVETVWELDRLKCSGKETARIMQVTSACVSSYLNGKRGAKCSLGVAAKAELKRALKLLQDDYINEDEFRLRLCDVMKEEMMHG